MRKRSYLLLSSFLFFTPLAANAKDYSCFDIGIVASNVYLEYYNGGNFSKVRKAYSEGRSDNDKERIEFIIGSVIQSGPPVERDRLREMRSASETIMRDLCEEGAL